MFTNTAVGTLTATARTQRKMSTLRFRSQIAYVRNISIASESKMPKTESHATISFLIRHCSGDIRVNLAERLRKVSTKGRYRLKTKSAVLIDHGRGQTYSISWSNVHAKSYIRIVAQAQRVLGTRRDSKDAAKDPIDQYKMRE